MINTTIGEAGREARARRRLKALGYYMEKAPARSRWRDAACYGGYMVRTSSNAVILGACGNPYSAELVDVEAFIAAEEKEPAALRSFAA